MKIAIHEGLNGFSPNWVKYCEANGLNYKIVSAYDTGVIEMFYLQNNFCIRFR